MTDEQAKCVGILLVACTAVLLLVGCSEPAAMQEKSVDSVSTPARAASRPSSDFADPLARNDDAQSAEGNDALIDRSPIESALGLEANPIKLASEHASYSASIAEHITACVGKEGWSSYVHREASPTPESFTSLRGMSDTLLEFGYGVTLNLRASMVLLGDLEEVDQDSSGSALEFVSNLDGAEGDRFAVVYNRCVDEAQQAIELPEQSIPEVLSSEVADLRSSARQSAPVALAWDRWRRCMRADSYEFQSRSEIIEALHSDPTVVEVRSALEDAAMSPDGLLPQERQQLAERIGSVSNHEQRLAQADAGCAEQSKLDETIGSAVNEAESAWLERNHDRLAFALAEERERPPKSNLIPVDE